MKPFLYGIWAAIEAWFLWTLNTYLSGGAGAGWLGTVVWWWALAETVFAVLCGVAFAILIVIGLLDA